MIYSCNWKMNEIECHSNDLSLRHVSSIRFRIILHDNVLEDKKLGMIRLMVSKYFILLFLICFKEVQYTKLMI